MNLVFNWTTAAMVSVPALLLWFAFVIWGRQQPEEDVYYDEDEVFPDRPQGRDDYQPWPGAMDTHDGWDADAEIETITALWSEAVDAGDTVLATCLFEEYERLCMEAYR